MKKILLFLTAATLLYQTNTAHSKEPIKKVEVLKIVKGSYVTYFPKSFQKKLEIVTPLYFHDWVGKIYAKNHKWDENTVLRRAYENAKNFCIGSVQNYLRSLKAKPQDYFIIIDNFDVDFKEDTYKFSTLVTGNCLLFKKK